MGTLLVNGVKASRVPPERTFGLPKGWAVHSTPAPAYELRYEGKRRRPPPLWELADVEQLVFFDHATREFAATPRPPPPRAVDDETGSEPHNATWPRIHFGVCALPRLGPRYEHVRSVLSQHTYLSLLPSLDGEREWEQTLERARALGLRFRQWRTWRGYLAHFVVYAEYLTFLHERRHEFEYGVFLEDDVLLPHDFRERVIALARARSPSRRLGRCASGDLLRTDEVGAMLERLRRDPISANDDVYFGLGRGPGYLTHPGYLEADGQGRLMGYVLPPGAIVHVLSPASWAQRLGGKPSDYSSGIKSGTEVTLDQNATDGSCEVAEPPTAPKPEVAGSEEVRSRSGGDGVRSPRPSD